MQPPTATLVAPLLSILPLATGAAAAAAVRRSRGNFRVQAVAATERPATKVTSQRYELPRGSHIAVRP
jgi:streptogramin lyase